MLFQKHYSNGNEGSREIILTLKHRTEKQKVKRVKHSTVSSLNTVALRRVYGKVSASFIPQPISQKRVVFQFPNANILSNTLQFIYVDTTYYP